MQTTGIQSAESRNAVTIRLLLAHLLPFGIFFVPVTPMLIVVAVLGYFVRVFAWEAGSHRYFAHRAFKTSRAFQLILAMLSAAASQRGPIWWASYHRKHHRFVDQPGDPHSPVQKGFWYAHLGWLYDHLETDLDGAPDLVRYPELVWVNKYHSLFPYIPLVAAFALGQWTSFFGRTGLGLSAALWVFVLPTTIFLHATCCVNSMAHTGSEKKSGWFSRRRFNSADATTNLWWLAIPTMGASWHNNHHRYMNSARAGFYRWEIDLSYITLRVLAALGIVWDLNPVPTKIMDEGRGLLPQESNDVSKAA